MTGPSWSQSSSPDAVKWKEPRSAVFLFDKNDVQRLALLYIFRRTALARLSGISRSTFAAEFRRVVGCSPT
jgi:AraC-like DNA-binding protein